jgi:hypothetical protein
MDLEALGLEVVGLEEMMSWPGLSWKSGRDEGRRSQFSVRRRGLFSSRRWRCW